jgi:hypothetical protein
MYIIGPGLQGNVVKWGGGRGMGKICMALGKRGVWDAREGVW